MKVIVRNGTNYSLIGIPADNLQNTIDCNEEVFTEFTITEEEQNYIDRGAIFSYVDDEFIFDDLTAVNEQIANQEKAIEIAELKTKTASEIVASNDNYYHLGLSGKEKGDLLIDVLLGGNNNLEHYVVRQYIAILGRKVFQNIEPTQEEQAFLAYANNLGVTADAILAKFREPV